MEIQMIICSYHDINPWLKKYVMCAFGVPRGTWGNFRYNFPNLSFDRERIARACARLSAIYVSVSQIAEECGFESLYSFSRTFKKEQGSSPLAYRKECDRRI